jgi:hypothetical protein
LLSLVGPSQTWYITRTLAHDSAEKGDSDVEYTFHLFVRPKDLKAEQWDGARSGIQAALDVFNADEVPNFLSCISVSY